MGCAKYGVCFPRLTHWSCTWPFQNGSDDEAACILLRYVIAYKRIVMEWRVKLYKFDRVERHKLSRTDKIEVRKNRLGSVLYAIVSCIGSKDGSIWDIYKPDGLRRVGFLAMWAVHQTCMSTAFLVRGSKTEEKLRMTGGTKKGILAICK